MSVLRSNVELTKTFMFARDQNHGNAPYVYGGALNTDPRHGTDCSEIWQTVFEMVFGRWVPGRQSEGATTESYRYIPVGGVGPFGTIRVARLADVPPDAAAIVCFHHEGNGGASSHMWGALDGVNIESGGSKGVSTGPAAMPLNSIYANAWAYLPGPIVNNTNTEVKTLAQGSLGQDVMRLQEALNRVGANPQLDVDGDYGILTAQAVMWYQQVNNLNADPKGVAGPEVLKLIGIYSSQPLPPSDEDGAQVLADVMGNAVSLDRYRQLWPAFRDCVNRCNAATPKRINMLVAQLGHESVSLKYMKEIGDAAYFSKYNNRADLGNGPTDGPRYPGRGPIQITGRSNYRQLSAWAFSKGYVPTPTYFEDRPEELEKDQYAFLGAIWYWTTARPKINEYCDWDNLEDSLVAVTKAINGGTNGLDDRRNRLNKARSMDLAPIMRGGPAQPQIPPTPPPSTQGGLLMYLTKEQETTVFRAAEKLLAPIMSNSPVRKVGEGTIGDTIDMIRFIDGNLHPILSEWLSKKGDTNEIKALEDLANVNLSRYPDRAYGARLAQEILARLADPVTPVVVNNASAGAETPQAPTVIYNVSPPATPTVPVIPNLDPNLITGIEPEKISPLPVVNDDTGDKIGNTFRSIEALGLNDDLPSELKAALDALIVLLNKKVEPIPAETEDQ